MKNVVRTLTALFIGIASAALGVIFQDDIASIIGRAPVSAALEYGPWHPLPVLEETSSRTVIGSQADQVINYVDDRKYKFARMNVKNNTGEEIKRAIVRIETSYREFDWDNFIVSYDRSPGVEKLSENGFSIGKQRVDIGPIPPASTKTVYLWFDQPFDNFNYPYSIYKITVTTELGNAPIDFGVSGNSIRDLDEDAISKFLWWAILFLVLSVVIFLIIAIYKHFVFIRALLSSDDFYLEQKIQYDGFPKTYAISDIPNHVAKALKEQHT